MNDALNRENWKEVRGIAHMIKGTGSSFVHPELTRLGKEICELLDQHKSDVATPLVQQLVKEMMQVVCRGR